MLNNSNIAETVTESKMSSRGSNLQKKVNQSRESGRQSKQSERSGKVSAARPGSISREQKNSSKPSEKSFRSQTNPMKQDSEGLPNIAAAHSRSKGSNPTHSTPGRRSSHKGPIKALHETSGDFNYGSGTKNSEGPSKRASSRMSQTAPKNMMDPLADEIINQQAASH